MSDCVDISSRINRKFQQRASKLGEDVAKEIVKELKASGYDLWIPSKDNDDALIQSDELLLTRSYVMGLIVSQVELAIVGTTISTLGDA